LKKATHPALAIVILLGGYLLLSSTVFLPDSLSAFDTKRLLQLVLFVIVMLFAVSWPPLRGATSGQLDRLSVYNRIILALFFALGLVSSLRLRHPAYALADVAMVFMLLITVMITAASREIAGRLFDKWAVILLALLGLAVALQEFMGFITGWMMKSEFNYTQAFIHFSHPRFYNQLQTWSVPIIAALPVLFPHRKWIRLICVCLLGLQWFLIIAVAARGTVVSLMSAMTLIALWLPAQRKSWLKYQVAGLLTGIALYGLVVILNEVFIPPSQSGAFYQHSAGRSLIHTSGRSTLWRLSIDDAISQPVLGTGPGRYACDSEWVVPAHPHSFLFRILGEWGIIALLLILVFIFSVGVKLLARLKHQASENSVDPPLSAILAISLIAGFIHACFSGLFIMPASQISFVLITGWGLSLCATARPTPRDSTRAKSVLLAGLLVSLSVLMFASREISHLTERTSYVKQGAVTVPRFWQNGKICEYSYSDQGSQP